MKYRLLFLTLHAAAAWLSLELAFMLRFYFDPLPFRYDAMLGQTLPVAILLKMLAADVCGLTRRIWRFASFRDVKVLLLSAVLGSLLFIPSVRILVGKDYPNGPLLLDFLLTLSLFSLIRFSGRAWYEFRGLLQGAGRPRGMRVLVLGAGERGEMALRFLQTRHQVLGFLDDRQGLQKRLLMGVPVLGAQADLPRILSSMKVEEVVIALEEPGPDQIRSVFQFCSAAGCRVSLMPEISSADALHGNPIRELKMSDFLGRQPVELDPAPLLKSLGGARVLVTGAGGSIGSELCRQIAAYPVEQLLMLDFSETALFEISEEIGGRLQLEVPHPCGGKTGPGMARVQLGLTQEAGEKGSGVRFEVLLCDIRFAEDLQALFDRVRPDVVFHAAAYKHVPMMEQHPLEAARTNILGTRNVVECAKKSGVKRLLHVSTDKAVEAEGVMGASKAWGERIVRAAGYSCVRFGNVLGSSGSVIPLFEKQWRRDGVLQVTHPEATRYFMTLEEAVLLMLHAEALQGSGNVYILDMGEPVKIMDLAKQMVELRSRNAVGRSPENDPAASPIRIVGLRPGERIHERLHTPEEQLEPTSVPKVNRLSGRVDLSGFSEHLATLEQAVEKRDPEKIRKYLLRGE